jgi:hypothetical protein
MSVYATGDKKGQKQKKFVKKIQRNSDSIFVKLKSVKFDGSLRIYKEVIKNNNPHISDKNKIQPQTTNWIYCVPAGSRENVGNY